MFLHMAQRSRYPGLKLVLTSIFFTLAVWAWVLTRPPGTFHDQGGMQISFLYFPLTLLIWFIANLAALVLMILRRRELPGTSWLITTCLSLLGLLLSLATLFIA
jgi:hypothetical protein